MTGAQATEPHASAAQQLSDPVRLAALHQDMLRFARLQLRDAELAEDAVQEAIEAALVNAASYAGTAALKTWVFGILRNKIVDILRRGSRSPALSTVIGSNGESEDEDGAIDALFRANGHWHPDCRPAAWAAPEESLENKQFWAVFEACLDHLPENIARVFMMREMLGLETAEICTELGITANNCHVILHRARTGLRGCLESNWFVKGACRTC
ncbi:MAG: sigma-70 family RNA polymerase sigma factor [Thauera sp.]|jgi:RNA polymerase sigma-70 factor (ECF subfamily)|uniref:Sigma-70 family RNA polymerase sigma factor n=1 Tax=Thauera sedimentorum TaxID=2767595 RepID=A0ABR9B811_9RHOO|nr:sigma-70 family RNA polymerase sigma factor [Thauera sedimentorum]MBC9071244.1 sigma-70 family RNA polymerase sigma factor [Thauera sedimentorum]MBD8502163.1 sigma-70 family RNA polymerase sigma factor [Thauera sedimentorum]MDX5409119.1 sigma-70 family RNA polymerase sigma factor [Thauera sp.]